jgi:hypothetical protein
MLGDFNAKVGWEDIFKLIFRNKSSHEISNDNGFNIVYFVTSKNLVFRSSIFPHHDVHKYT